MKPAAFDYVAPATIEEALETLAGAGGDAVVLAGGQSLLPLMALRMSTPSVVVDINRIDSLRGVVRTSDGMQVGPVTRQNTIIASDALQSALPVLVDATRHVGHPQTRNRGTIGGSIALGEPAAELPAVAVALGATIEARSKRGLRTIAADAFYVGPYSSVLEPDELITAIRFPDWPRDSLFFFREVARRPGDFALIGLVGALAVEQGRIVRAGIAWFGMGPMPMKARQAESALAGRRLGELDAGAIAELAIADTEPFDDRHATARYRRTVGRRVFTRTLQEALNSRQAA